VAVLLAAMPTAHGAAQEFVPQLTTALESRMTRGHSNGGPVRGLSPLTFGRERPLILVRDDPDTPARLTRLVARTREM
jgi:hypothetical protein